MRYCETLLYRFPTYNGPLKEMFWFYHFVWKSLKTTAKKNIWKAHTFPPSDKNNWQGQKCMLKTVIFKVSCFQTFFQIFSPAKNHWNNGLRCGFHNFLHSILDIKMMNSQVYFIKFWFFWKKLCNEPVLQ